MPFNDDDRKELSALLSRPFLGACGLIVVLSGALAGHWISGVKEDLREIRTTLNSRADLPTRTIELERRDEDKEHRLRIIEQDHWKVTGH